MTTHPARTGGSPAVDPGRRWLVGGSLAGAAVAAAGGAIPVFGAERRTVRIGLVGCGSRGTWIAGLFKKHGGYEIHAVGDTTSRFGNETVPRAGDGLLTTILGREAAARRKRLTMEQILQEAILHIASKTQHAK